VNNFVPDFGSTSDQACGVLPTNGVIWEHTGITRAMDCFNYTGNSLVLPVANTTANNQVRFEFFLNSQLGSGDNLRLTFTRTTSPNPVYQVVTGIYANDQEGKRGTFTMPLTWSNTSFLRGCQTSCVSGSPITSLPLGTYNIRVEAKDNSTPSSWVDLGTRNSVTVTDTITSKPQIYLQAYSYFPISGSATVQVSIPEPRNSGTAVIKLSNKPSFLSPNLSRVYHLGSGSLGGNIELPFSGMSSSPDIVSVSDTAITPGQWWVSVTYQDALGNPGASDEWAYPLLITRVCTAGSFSVNGIEYCIGTPVGYQIQSPYTTAFNSDSKSFAPTKCAAGTYQPTVGGPSCLAAEAGHYVLESGSSAQLACPIGTFQADTGQHACFSARAGHFANSLAATTDTECEPGTYQSETGKISCNSSDANYFVSSKGSKSQIACPLLTYSSAGAKAAGDCKPKPCVVPRGASASAACMLASVAQVLPAKAKVSIKMNKTFKKTCKVSGASVKALANGTCTAMLTVKPKKGKSTKYTVQVTGS
jgi:hypothetical protein